jgi:hypothetical protein
MGQGDTMTSPKIGDARPAPDDELCPARAAGEDYPRRDVVHLPIENLRNRDGSLTAARH